MSRGCNLSAPRSVLRLKDDDAYGVTILEELEHQTSRSPTLGTVYRILGRLENKGYLATRVAPPTRERGGRRKKLYSLTPAGLEAATRSLADLRRLAKSLVMAYSVTQRTREIGVPRGWTRSGRWERSEGQAGVTPALSASHMRSQGIGRGSLAPSLTQS